MPDTNCILAHTSPEHAIQMILQVRHLNSSYVVIPQYFFKKYRGTIFVNTAHSYVYVNAQSSCHCLTSPSHVLKHLHPGLCVAQPDLSQGLVLIHSFPNILSMNDVVTRLP